MAKLPPPPAADVLAARTPPDVVAVTRATTLWRIYPTGGPHAGRWDDFRSYGPLTTARFDHHLPPPRRQERAVLYVGLAIATCVAEVFQDTRVIDRRRRGPWLVGFRLRRAVHLLDLTGDWPTRAGASQAISSGRRDRARAWAAAIHAAYPAVEGLWYRSSMHGGQPAVALTERAIGALRAQPDVHLPLAHPSLEVPLGRMAASLGYLLA